MTQLWWSKQKRKKIDLLCDKLYVFLVNPHCASSGCCFELTDLITGRNLTQELTALTRAGGRSITVLLPCKIITLTHETHQTSATYNESVWFFFYFFFMKTCWNHAKLSPQPTRPVLSSSLENIRHKSTQRKLKTKQTKLGKKRSCSETAVPNPFLNLGQHAVDFICSFGSHSNTLTKIPTCRVDLPLSLHHWMHSSVNINNSSEVNIGPIIWSAQCHDSCDPAVVFFCAIRRPCAAADFSSPTKGIFVSPLAVN